MAPAMIIHKLPAGDAVWLVMVVARAVLPIPTKMAKVQNHVEQVQSMVVGNMVNCGLPLSARIMEFCIGKHEKGNSGN